MYSVERSSERESEFPDSVPENNKKRFEYCIDSLHVQF